MLTLNTPLPPAPLTDDAMKLCAALLQIASDPSAMKTRLDELSAATQGLRDAIAQHDAAAKTAQDAVAALADVEQRSREVASREAALTASQTQLSVASGANVSRQQVLNERSAELDQRESEVAAKERALAAKVESYRAALTG